MFFRYFKTLVKTSGEFGALSSGVWLNERSFGKLKCHQFTHIVDVGGNDIGCECIVGYLGDGVSCIDVDECTAGIANCGGGICVNTNGSFKCICSDGFHFVDGKCVEVDECANNLNHCVSSVRAHF